MRYVVVWIVAIVGCGGSAPRPPGPFVTPGPLIAGHAALACEACHSNTAVDVAKCAGCHASVARGLHARPEMQKPCASCHHDHEGAQFDAIGWQTLRGGRDGFDHALAGWPLNGAHGRARCAECHTQATPLGRPTFLGAVRTCEGCHARQPHGTQLACGRCHTTGAWAPPKRVLAFDHRTEARMPIAGAHEKLACVQCHPAGTFALRLADPARCESCHQSPHAQQPYGAVACATCHSVTSFALIAKFDHATFDLGAAHRGRACASCHTPALGARLPSTTCVSCHAAASPHAERFKAFGSPSRCGDCHAPVAVWKPNRFDHAKQGGWPLDRWHAQETCRACHRGATPADFERLGRGKDCMGCHAHRMVHADEDHPQGKFSNAKCLQCHVR